MLVMKVSMPTANGRQTLTSLPLDFATHRRDHLYSINARSILRNIYPLLLLFFDLYTTYLLY